MSENLTDAIAMANQHLTLILLLIIFLYVYSSKNTGLLLVTQRNILAKLAENSNACLSVRAPLWPRLKISITVKRITTTFCTEIHCAQKMNFNDYRRSFSTNAAMTDLCFWVKCFNSYWIHIMFPSVCLVIIL